MCSANKKCFILRALNVFAWANRSCYEHGLYQNHGLLRYKTEILLGVHCQYSRFLWTFWVGKLGWYLLVVFMPPNPWAGLPPSAKDVVLGRPLMISWWLLLWQIDQFFTFTSHEAPSQTRDHENRQISHKQDRERDSFLDLNSHHKWL